MNHSHRSQHREAVQCWYQLQYWVIVSVLVSVRLVWNENMWCVIVCRMGDFFGMHVQWFYVFVRKVVTINACLDLWNYDHDGTYIKPNKNIGRLDVNVSFTCWINPDFVFLGIICYHVIYYVYCLLSSLLQARKIGEAILRTLKPLKKVFLCTLKIHD